MEQKSKRFWSLTHEFQVFSHVNPQGIVLEILHNISSGWKHFNSMNSWRFFSHWTEPPSRIMWGFEKPLWIVMLVCMLWNGRGCYVLWNGRGLYSGWEVLLKIDIDIFQVFLMLLTEWHFLLRLESMFNNWKGSLLFVLHRYA